ncbi:MAG: DoxX family protein [Planctomycetota bacterium]
MALLFVRVIFGIGIALHGVGKIESPTDWLTNAMIAGGVAAEDAAAKSPPPAAQALAAYSEFVGGLMLAAGLFTRLHGILLAGTMVVAIGTAHGPQGDPFYRSHDELNAPVVVLKDVVNVTLPEWLAKGGADAGAGKWEPAGMYLAAAGLLVLMGPGLLSADRLLFGPAKSRPKTDRD